MLRPGIIGSIIKYPGNKHILHIFDKVADIFSDIKGLQIVPLKSYNNKFDESRELLANYKSYKLFELSDCDAKYEMDNLDHIVKSRQEIYCDVIGVDFSKDNYKFNFTKDEMQVALDFIGDRQCIGVHLKSAEKWRDYRFVTIKKDQLKMWNIIDRLSKRYKGYIVVFDNNTKYIGKRKNIISFISKNIRHTLAVMSLMNIGIGPDSFGVHAFGALGIPVYGLFGPTNPAIRLKYNIAFWSPRSNCDYQYCWYKYPQCPTGISCLNIRTSKFYVDDIYKKMSNFLGV